MHKESLSISVRFRHPSMSPNDITLSLGVEPAAAHPVGGARKSPSGRELGGQFVETYWAYKLCDRSNSDVSEAIGMANAWMQLRSAFVAEFARSGGTMEYYISVTCNGRLAAELTPSLLAQCGQLEVKLSLEVFNK
jgi:hypothetical protein